MAKLASQVNALLRKNAVYQRRKWQANTCLVCAPIVICVLLVIIQAVVNSTLDKASNKCGCQCLSCSKDVDSCTTDPSTGVESCQTQKVFGDTPQFCSPGNYDTCLVTNTDLCGLEYSDKDQAGFCGVENPPILPTFQLVPETGARAAAPGGSDALPIMLTGENASVSQALFGIMYASSNAAQLSSFVDLLSASGSSGDLGSPVAQVGLKLGTPEDTYMNYLVDPALLGNPLYALATNCSTLSQSGLTSGPLRIPAASGIPPVDVNLSCSSVVAEQEPSVSAINEKLFCGWKDARCDGLRLTRGYASPIDFQDTSESKLAFRYWTNFTNTLSTNAPPTLMRANQVMGLVYESFLAWMTGLKDGVAPRFTSSFTGIASFPTISTRLRLDFSSLIGPLFYTWLLQMLLPTMIVQLVYEKQYRLRGMMKMHGLSDATYWVVMCSWYFVLYIIFDALLLVFGSIVNLKFFRLNSYGVQVVFLLIFTVNQIPLACLASTLYSNARTAVVTTFVYVFASGLVANILIDQFYQEDKWFNTLLYFYPPFALYRAMYEYGQYAFRAAYVNGVGITFGKFSETNNDMWQVFLILALEAPVFFAMAWYFNAVLPGHGVHRHWLFCLPWLRRHKKSAPNVDAEGRKSEVDAQIKPETTGRQLLDGAASHGAAGVSGGRAGVTSSRRSGSKRWELEAEADVAAEAEAAALADPREVPIILRNVRKVFPAREGQPEKMAVDNVSLTVRKGECFGMLGPNGAGKSTTIGMMVGMTEATAGDLFIAGYDLSEAKDDVYRNMGVCPQDNLLWDTLTAREHLLFYGRLKGLKGPELKEAVDAALTSVQLLSVGNKQSRQYSGGMKRRLSVAISLIGWPAVVYLDEPSTGLDPASRQALWSAVKADKKDHAIILTTHSMQEAEILCDRLAIIVNGKLVCIGNPRQLTAAYGNYLELSITVPPTQLPAAEAFVHSFCPEAVCTYKIAGTLRYELPTSAVSVRDVFGAMHGDLAAKLTILDWGLANATLEEVFIKVARQVGATSAD